MQYELFLSGCCSSLAEWQSIHVMDCVVEAIESNPVLSKE